MWRNEGNGQGNQHTSHRDNLVGKHLHGPEHIPMQFGRERLFTWNVKDQFQWSLAEVLAYARCSTMTGNPFGIVRHGRASSVLVSGHRRGRLLHPIKPPEVPLGRYVTSSPCGCHRGRHASHGLSIHERGPAFERNSSRKFRGNLRHHRHPRHCTVQDTSAGRKAGIPPDRTAYPGRTGMRQ